MGKINSFCLQFNLQFMKIYRNKIKSRTTCVGKINFNCVSLRHPLKFETRVGRMKLNEDPNRFKLMLKLIMANKNPFYNSLIYVESLTFIRSENWKLKTKSLKRKFTSNETRWWNDSALNYSNNNNDVLLALLWNNKIP